ncbi:MAG: ATP-dependent DNA helicase RecG, partial [Alphaproteobacteria bacterium]
MRPALLNPLFSPVTALNGVGPRLQSLLQRLFPPLDTHSGVKVVDLLFHLPAGLIDRRYRPKVAEARPGSVATLVLTVMAHVPPPKGKRRAPYRIRAGDDTGTLDLVFFHGNAKYLEGQLPVGERRILSGRIERYGDHLQMPHPDHIVREEESTALPLLEPVYPLTAGLSGKVLGRAIRQALGMIPDLPEWQDPDWLKKQGWPSFAQSLRALHAPQGESDLMHSSAARQRIAYDELLANQLALALVRRKLRKGRGRPVKGDGGLRNSIVQDLPFALTASQKQVLEEICTDMAAPHRMLRLLQGDVGSGKTVVALLAMANAVEAGHQAALMAPTEVLARQHFKTLAPLAQAAGLRLALLTGREKGKERTKLLEQLATGQIDILLGTHALFQEGVIFHDLALAVIDEQHRFGVHQRLALQSKGPGAGTDVLVMTATPIPRTLLLTHYGDMDVSRLLEKPAGRKPVATRAVPAERLAEVIERLKGAVDAGAQAYWVCPLVEQSDRLDVAAAEERYAALQQIFGDRVALIHGRMKAAEKDAVMAAFAE